MNNYIRCSSPYKHGMTGVYQYGRRFHVRVMINQKIIFGGIFDTKKKARVVAEGLRDIRGNIRDRWSRDMIMIGRDTLQSVCRELGVPARWVRASGIGKTRLVTEARIEVAKRLDQAGWTRGRIAMFLKCTPQTVDYYIMRRS